jgi:hypothetical protein
MWGNILTHIGVHHTQGNFKDYKKAERAYDEAKQAIELAKKGLALLDGMSRGK